MNPPEQHIIIQVLTSNTNYFQRVQQQLHWQAASIDQDPFSQRSGSSSEALLLGRSVSMDHPLQVVPTIGILTVFHTSAFKEPLSSLSLSILLIPLCLYLSPSLHSYSTIAAIMKILCMPGGLCNAKVSRPDVGWFERSLLTGRIS